MKYIGENVLVHRHAGSKARVDVDAILFRRFGRAFEYVGEKKFSNSWQRICFFLNPALWIKILKLRALKDSWIFLQYPFPFISILKKTLKKVIERNHVVLFVHDVDSLRGSGKMSAAVEFSMFNSCSIIVVHNEKMAEIFRKHGITTQIVTLELFDYLLEGKIPMVSRKLDNVVVFAGSLAKSSFLLKDELQLLGVKFNLYGIGFDQDKMGGENVSYGGSFLPNEVPYKLEGSFGLIWDGDDLTTCSGRYGTYMRINNPHKLSLYIAAKLPVITWKEAAIADFIEKYNIGFVVDGLGDIEKKISNLTESQYEEYLKNLEILQKKVVDGYFTDKAFSECEKIIGE